MADYAMKVEKGITVTMRDGVRLSLCVYRPDTAGQFPALFAASPYQYEMDEVQAYPLFLWRETGPVEWYVSQGYAYVHADVRGAGQSEGEFEFMGLNEQQDYLELIAWIVKQPWCTGRVGGIGQSYYAMAQWLMATYNPPGLACIVPYDGLVDQYRGSNYHGGIYCSYRSVWYTSLRADNQHRLAGKHGRPPMKFDLVGEIINHPLDDDFWRAALALLAARQDQVPGAVSRALGQDGPASARQYPRLRGGQGAEEARRHRRAQYFRGAPHVRPGRIPRKRVAAVLRSSSQRRQQRLHGCRAGKAVRTRRQCLAQQRGLAATARDAARLLPAQGPVGQRHFAQRWCAVGRAACRRRSGDKLHLSRLGMGQWRRRYRCRTAGSIRRAVCSHSPARRSTPISTSPGRSCSSCSCHRPRSIPSSSSS